MSWLISVSFIRPKAPGTGNALLITVYSMQGRQCLEKMNTQWTFFEQMMNE